MVGVGAVVVRDGKALIVKRAHEPRKGEWSLPGGLLVAVVLIAWNQLFGWITSRSRRIEALLDGRPEVLIHNGSVYADVLARNRLSLEELRSTLRRQGCFDLNEVEFAVLETNGAISVKTRSTT